MKKTVILSFILLGGINSILPGQNRSSMKVALDESDSYYIEIDNNSIYEQGFDVIGTEAVATLPTGWKIEKRLDAPRTLGSYSLAGNQTEQAGGNNIASNAKNGIYNFAAGNPEIATDRAIGGISTGIENGTRCVNIYLKLRNTGNSVLNRFNIKYDVEKYRKGNNGAGFIMQMYYSSDGFNWTSAGNNFYTFFGADNVTEGYAEVPGDVKNVNAGFSQVVEAGKDLYLAWNYSVADGTAAAGAQALALDNVIIETVDNANPIPTSIDIKPKNVTLLTDLPEEAVILSLNNSLIYNNDQAAVFNQLASAAGKTANWTLQTRLGQSLRYHYEEGDGANSARMQVRSKAWTHILLQEQSNKPLTNPADFKASVKLWVDYVKANCPNPNAKIMLTLNWPYTESSAYEQESKQLYDTYKAIAEDLGVSVCPVGNAYEIIRQTDGEAAKNALYTDNRHPTMLATYLAACMVYGSIFDTTPVGLSYYPTQINAADATHMQTRAWETVSMHEDVVNDHKGTVRYSYYIYDQYNDLMDKTEIPVRWTVSGGGAIENNVFSTNGEEGTFDVSIQNDEYAMSTQTSLKVVKAYQPVTDNIAIEIGSNDIYEQDFDEIGIEATASLPLGWKIEKRLDAPRMLGSYSLAGNQTEQAGGNNIASNAKNGIYNFAAGNPEIATDRAIGGISTGIDGGTRGINIYVRIRNTGEKEIRNFAITYDVEKYRMGNNAAGFIMQMYYSSDGYNWTSAGNDFKTTFVADGSTEGYENAPGEVKNIKATLFEMLKPQEEIYLAWNYSVASGTTASGAQALGLDNVTIKTSEEDLDYVEITPEKEYRENFDQIGTKATAKLPFGWKIARKIRTPHEIGKFKSANTETTYSGGNNLASNADNGIYNFGAGDATTATDRAIGGITTGSADGNRVGAKSINIFLKIKNTGEEKINSLDIAYDVEKYRKGSNPVGFNMKMYYSYDGDNWSDAGENFITTFDADAITEGYANAPGESKKAQANLLQSLEPNQNIYLAWNYTVISGEEAHAAQALAIDNVVVKTGTKVGLENISQSNNKIFYYQGILHITGKNIEKVSLYDIRGILITNYLGEGSYDISELPAGIYIVRANIAQQSGIFTQKIVK